MIGKTKEELVELIKNDKDAFIESCQGVSDIDLSETDFSGCELSQISFVDVDFSGASFAEAQISEVNFTNCDLSSANFSRSTVNESDFSESVLNGTDFSYAKVSFSNFPDADMAGCIFNEADLSNSDFSSSVNMSASRFDESTLWPEQENLPEDFDSTYNYDLSSLKDEEEEESSEFGY